MDEVGFFEKKILAMIMAMIMAIYFDVVRSCYTFGHISKWHAAMYVRMYVRPYVRTYVHARTLAFKYPIGLGGIREA